jgi:hypothetical protein
MLQIGVWTYAKRISGVEKVKQKERGCPTILDTLVCFKQHYRLIDFLKFIAIEDPEDDWENQ